MPRGRPKKIIEPEIIEEAVTETVTDSVQEVIIEIKKPDVVIVQQMNGYRCYMTRAQAQEQKALGQVVSIHEV